MDKITIAQPFFGVKYRIIIVIFFTYYCPYSTSHMLITRQSNLHAKFGTTILYKSPRGFVLRRGPTSKVIARMPRIRVAGNPHPEMPGKYPN